MRDVRAISCVVVVGHVAHGSVSLFCCYSVSLFCSVLFCSVLFCPALALRLCCLGPTVAMPCAAVHDDAHRGARGQRVCLQRVSRALLRQGSGGVPPRRHRQGPRPAPALAQRYVGARAPWCRWAGCGFSGSDHVSVSSGVAVGGYVHVYRYTADGTRLEVRVCRCLLCFWRCGEVAVR